MSNTRQWATEVDRSSELETAAAEESSCEDEAALEEEAAADDAVALFCCSNIAGEHMEISHEGLDEATRGMRTLEAADEIGAEERED